MGVLKQNQIEVIEKYVRDGGLSFDPLKSELLDHLICDIEVLMKKGSNFSRAWLTIKHEIPNNHLKNIEKETMELMHKKIKVSRLFAGISLGLLILASTFKLMHLPGAAILLIGFFVFTSLILLLGSARSVYIYKEKKGRAVILITAFILTTFIGAFCFRILHLPGAIPLNLFSIISLSILFPALSIYFYRSKQKLKDHLIIGLIDGNKKTLENTALMLIGFGIVFNYATWYFGQENFIGVVFYFFTIILTGLYVYALTWQQYVNSENPSSDKSNLNLLITSSVAFVMFMIPVLFIDLDANIRLFMAYGSFIIFTAIVLVHYSKYSKYIHKNTLLVMSSIVLVYLIFRLGNKLELFSSSMGEITSNPVLNIGYLLFLCVILVAFRKEKLFKSLIIIMIALHMIPSM
jgi:hypothetical protein